MRLVIRDEEWLLRNVIRTNQGKCRLDVIGLSPLVRDMNYSFMVDIETKDGKDKNGIVIIDPKKTKPVYDDSPYYRKSRLHLETLIRATAPSDTKIHLGHKAAMDVVPYQLEPANIALQQPRQRILIADAVGLGKTIECGVLLTELIKRGRARRILVVTVKSMLEQFQKELWSRFSIPLVRLDSVAIRRIRRHIPTNQNPFHYYDKSIVSIDTIKQAGDYRRFLQDARWDVIIIDEAHNVAQRSSNSQRESLARTLANRADSLIMLSATPHDGKKESFASLMNLLDPTAIANPSDYGPEDIEGLYIRRFKKDISKQISKAFPERSAGSKLATPTRTEQAVFASLAALELHIDREGTQRRGAGAAMLVKTLLGKAFSSSPAACSSVLDTRIKNLSKSQPNSPDIPVLRHLKTQVDAVTPADFSKYQLLVQLLRKGGELNWSRATDDRLVIFTESIPTLNFLATHLPADIGLKPDQYVTMTGAMPDVRQMEIVDDFGNAAKPLRLLICSDVASEGINLHHQAHRMIHFDIPWSLLTFQQRNGRIDRYGQTQKPEITYLFTDNENCGVRGDARVLKILIDKDRQVQENIGDPLEFEALKGLETLEEEEVVLTAIIEKENAAIELERQLTVKQTVGFNFLSSFTGKLNKNKEEDTTQATAAELIADGCSLFRDDYDYAKALCEFAKDRIETRSKGTRSFKYSALDKEKTLRLTVPSDFYTARLKRQFPGVYHEGDEWFLSADKKTVMDVADRERHDPTGEHGWPMTQLLWERHPLVEWLASKVSADFARNTAPIIAVPGLSRGQRIVLGLATIPNRNGVPVVQLWHGALFNGERFERLLPIEECLKICGLSSGATVPNAGPPADLNPENTQLLQDIIATAVDRMEDEAVRQKRAYEAQVGPKLDTQLRRLENFKKSRTEQLTLQFDAFNQQKRRETAVEAVNKAYEDTWRFIEDALSAEDRASVIITTIFTSK